MSTPAVTATVDPSTAMKVRMEVAGADHIRHADGSLNPALLPMRALMTEWAWGQVWSREGLDRRTRIFMNLGILVAANRPNELRMAIRIAIRHSISHAEIGEAILHSAVYCGVPAASGALSIASEEFAGT